MKNETTLETLDILVTKEEIEAILVSMSYYNLRNPDKTINQVDVGYGGELYLKLANQSKFSIDRRVENVDTLNRIQLRNDLELLSSLTDTHNPSTTKAIGNIGRLIEEHFDNPPLDAKELKEGMWVWYQSPYICAWVRIYKVERNRIYIYYSQDCKSYQYLLFEENCFYLKEIMNPPEE